MYKWFNIADTLSIEFVYIQLLNHKQISAPQIRVPFLKIKGFIISYIKFLLRIQLKDFRDFPRISYSLMMKFTVRKKFEINDSERESFFLFAIVMH